MRTHKCTLSALTLTAAMTFGATAMAADLPKQGTDSFTNNWVITQMNSIKAGDRSVFTFEVAGTTRNDAGGSMFNYVGQHCVGSLGTIGNEASLNDFLCTYTDKDGDQTLRRQPAKGQAP
jgi:hypothetical protein